MSFYTFLFLLISIGFSEITNPSKDYIRNLQSDDGYSDIRIYVDYSCYSSITNTCK